MIVSEIGTDMSRFPSANHLACWAGVAPGNNESAGKRRSGKTRKGNQVLCAALNQAAHAAARTKDTYLSAQYRRLAARRGKKKAIVALEHTILVMAYHLIQRNEPYRELGGNYFDNRRPEATARRLVKRLEQLGFSVALQQPHPSFLLRYFLGSAGKRRSGKTTKGNKALCSALNRAAHAAARTEDTLPVGSIPSSGCSSREEESDCRFGAYHPGDCLSFDQAS